MPIIITCKKPGFRRCGIAHPAGPVEYPDNRFTTKELEKLIKEPMLIVQVVEASKDKKSCKKGLEEKVQKAPPGDKLIEGHLDKAFLESMDYQELKRLAKDMRLEFKANISKAALAEMVAAEPCLVSKDAGSEDTDLDQQDITQDNQQDASPDDVSGADQ